MMASAKKIVAAALIISIVVSPFLLVINRALAAPFPIRGSGGRGVITDPNQVLQDRRQEDQQSCEEAAGKFGGINGLAQQGAQGLAQVVSQRLNETLGEKINKIFTEKVPKVLQETLEREIPRIVENGLGERLPRFLENEMANLAQREADADEINRQLPEIFLRGIETVIPEIAQRRIPSTLENNLKNDLPKELTREIEKEMTKIGDEVFKEQLTNLILQIVIQIGLQAMMGGGGGGQILSIIPSILEQLMRAASAGINQSQALIDFSHQYAAAYLQEFTPLLLQGLTPKLREETKNFTGPGGRGATSITGLINALPDPTGIGRDFLQGLNIENTLKSLSTDIGRVIGQSWATDIRGWQINSVLNNASTQSIMNGDMVRSLNRIPGVRVEGAGLRYLSPDGQLIPDDFVGPPDPSWTSVTELKGFQAEGFSTAVGADAAASTMAATSKIGTDTASKMAGGINWSALGTELQATFTAGLANGLSAGLTGLVAGVPFAGPLLAPLVQQMTQQIFTQLLGGGGMGAGAVSVPALDYGLNAAVSFSVVPELGKIEGNTKAISQINQEILSLHTQICTYEKATKRIATAMEDLTYVHEPNVAKASIRALLEMRTSFGNFLRTGALVSRQQTGVEPPPGGGDQSEGGPLFVQNLDDKIAAAQEEAASVYQHHFKLHNAAVEDAQQIVEELKKQQATRSNLPPRPTITRGELERSGSGSNSNDTLNYWNKVLRGSSPEEDPRTKRVMAMSGQLSEENKAETRVRETFIAYGGYEPVEVPVDEETEDGAPLKRKIVTPGSFIGELASVILASPIWRAIFADKFQEDAILPLLRLVQKGAADLTAPSDQEEITQQDPCPDAEPCPNTGWQQQVDLRGFERAREESRSSSGFGGRRFFDSGVFGNTITGALERLIQQGFNLGQDSINNLLTGGLNEIPRRIRGNESNDLLAYKLFLIFTSLLENDRTIVEENDKIRIADNLAQAIFELILSRR